MDLDKLIDDIIFLSDNDNITFLYHITDKSNGDNINENGLGLIENRLSSTTIKVPDVFFENLNLFVEEEYSKSDTRKKEIAIIIGCYEDDVNCLIQENNIDLLGWNEEDNPSYIIPSENILGYIDMENKEFIVNENSMFRFYSNFY